MSKIPVVGFSDFFGNTWRFRARAVEMGYKNLGF